jgi:hypothetical protein
MQYRDGFEDESARRGVPVEVIWPEGASRDA